MLGYIIAGIGSIFFSLYVVPRKLSKIKPLEFCFLMSISFFACSLVAYAARSLFLPQEKVSSTLLLSVLAGVIWSAAFVAFIRSIDLLGLSRSNQWKNLQGPVAAILSLIVLSEHKTIHPVFVVLAGGAVFLSALCFNIANKKIESATNLRGVHLAVLSGFGFGTVAMIQKYVTSNTGVYLQTVIWSLSITFSIGLLLLFTKQSLPKLNIADKESRLPLLAGVLYFAASLMQLLAYKQLPASIVFTIIQLNAVWTVAIGVLYFKEISVITHYKRLLLGFLFTFAGIALLSLAKH
jgi:glucose uptake protein GlcU